MRLVINCYVHSSPFDFIRLWQMLQPVLNFVTESGSLCYIRKHQFHRVSFVIPFSNQYIISESLYKYSSIYPERVYKKPLYQTTTMYLLILAVIGYLHKTIYMSNDVDFYNFKKLSSVDDKIVIQPTMFYLNCSSRIRCVGKCAASQGCVSVFYSNNSICQGHTEVFERYSHFLVSKPGFVYYVSKNRAG